MAPKIYVEGSTVCIDLWWRHLWKANSHPHDGEVAEMRGITRARCHRAARYIVKNTDKIRMETMAKAIAEHRSRDL